MNLLMYTDCQMYHNVMEWFDPLSRIVGCKPIKFWRTSDKKKKKNSWSRAILSDNSKWTGQLPCCDHSYYVTSIDIHVASGNMSNRHMLCQKKEFWVRSEQRIYFNNSGIISQGDLFEGSFTCLDR